MHLCMCKEISGCLPVVVSTVLNLICVQFYRKQNSTENFWLKEARGGGRKGGEGECQEGY